MNRTLNLKDRLSACLQLMKECKLFAKNNEFKLSQEKLKLDALKDLSPLHLKILQRFMYDVYQEHIEPFFEGEGVFGYQNIFGNQPPAIQQECVVNFQYLVVTVFCKLMSPEEGQQSVTESKLLKNNSNEHAADQIKLATFLLIKMMFNQELKKEMIVSSLCFAELSINDLQTKFEKKNINKEDSIHADALSMYPEARPLIEALFNGYLAISAACLDILDQEPILQPVCRILSACYRLQEKFSSVFNSKIYDISSPNFPVGFVFKERLLESGTGRYYTQTTLLNLQLQITKVISGKWKSRYNRGLMTQELQKLQDQVDTSIMQGLDHIILRQIRVYQQTEQFVKSSNSQLQTKSAKNQPFESIKEVEESFVSEDSDQNQPVEETKSPPLAKPVFQKLQPGELSIYNSAKIILDPALNLKAFKQDQPVTLLEDAQEQRNWIRVNIGVMEVSNELMPGYFHRKENELAPNQKMSSPGSLISHLCDLVRVQLCFVVRFSFFSGLLRKFTHPIIEIPDFPDYDCFLVQTLRTLFFFVDYKGQNHEYRTIMVKQIYLTLDMIADGYFDSVDRYHYLKLMFLLFMNNKLEPLSEPIAVLYEINRAYSCIASLNKLIKIEFYSEKYVRLFEETFDLNSIQDILQLQEIVKEWEQKRTDELTNNSNAADDAIILINKVLVQAQAINQLVQTAEKSDIVCGIALDQLIGEIQVNGMKNCDPQGAIYVERSQHLTLQNGQSQVSTLEYKLAQSGPFSSQIYIYFKLALGLINSQTTAQGKAFDILNYSDIHFEKWHQAQSYAMSKSSFGLRGSSQSHPGFQAHQVQSSGLNQCDDCQRLNFQNFTLNVQVRPFQLISLFTILLKRIQDLSKSLDDQEQAQNNQLGQGQLKQMTNMSAEQIRSHLSKIKLGQNQGKVITKKTLIANQSSGFKIVEKVNGLMTRFILYCSQNTELVNSIIASITNMERGEAPKFPSLLDNQKLKSLQISLFQPVNLRDINNIEFKSTLLRNLIFLIDSKRYDTVTYILELMRDNLKQIKLDHTKYKEHSADFKRLMTQLDPFHKQRQSQDGSYLRGGRERSASNIFFVEYDSHIQKQKHFYRKLAEVQITTLSLYTKVVRKDDHCLEIFERKVFLEQVLMHLQRYIIQEGSYISELIQEGLAIFLFQRREPCDPFNIKSQTSLYENPLIQQSQANSLVSVYERMFEFVLTTILDYIQAVFNDDQETASQDAQTSVLQSIKLVLETLNNKIMVREGNTVRESITSDLIKLQRSIRPTEINLLKKIFIFLREQQTTQTVDIQYTIKQMSTLLIRLFGVIPKAIHMREFFSFLREIFYHNKMMDDVDVNLAEDVLKILNYSINFRNKTQIYGLGSAPRNEMIDHFVFSKIAPGILVLNDFDLSREPSICLLFRISHEQIAQELSMQRKKQIVCVLFSIQQRQAENNQNTPMDKIGFDLELIVDIEKGTFTLQDPPAVIQTNSQNQPNVQQFKPRMLENRWHMLILKYKHKSGGFLSNNDTYNLEVYLDKLDQANRVVYQLPRMDPRQRYLVSLGNSVDFCTSNGDNRAQNKYFRGRCSLPFFFTGLPDIKSLEQSTEILRAIRESLTEFLNTKELIGKKQLDLNRWVQKYLPDGSQFKQNKKYIITEFSTLDNFTQQVIQLHQTLNKQGYLCAAHCRRASEVFVGLGGFKTMYPLIDKVIKSNLIELGRGKPAQILSQAFKVLGSLLDQEPVHIEVHRKKRNLIPLLRYCILRLGKYQLITQDLLSDIKNIVRKNILSQVAFTSQNEKQYLIQSASGEIRGQKQFYADFLSDYTHEILLDRKIAMLTCQIVTKAHPDVSSTTHSSISGGPKQTVVFTEILDLIHHICAPEPLKNQGPSSKSQKHTRTNSKSSDNDKNQESASSQMENSAFAGGQHAVQLFCDGEILQQNIVTHRTIDLLIELASNTEILQQLLYQQIYQLGECLSSSILYLDDQKSFTQILHKVTQEHTGISKIQLLIYLQVVLQVIRCDDLRNKQQLYGVYTDKSQFKIESIAVILCQFEQNPREKITEDIRTLNDKIIAMTLLVLTKDFLLTKKLQASKNKAIVEKVAAFDQEKKDLVKVIKKYLANNSQINAETYLTLMQIAFNKRNCLDRPPMLDEIDIDIKESRLRMENKQSSEVIDFDIDFYFIVLECSEKLIQQTKIVFLNQIMLFLKNHEENFMKLLVGQVSSEDRNPFLAKIKIFYYQVVKLCLESKEEVMIQSCQRVLVEICVNHFTRSLDELNENKLSQQDEISLFLFRRIFTYFDQEFKSLFQVLQKILKQILIDINYRKQTYSQIEQAKLNLKLIQMLQFLEEVYINNKSELTEIPIFHQTLALLMLLLEQLGLLSMDGPDRIASDKFPDYQSSNKIKLQKGIQSQQFKAELDTSNTQVKIQVNLNKQDEQQAGFYPNQGPVLRSPSQASSHRQLAPPSKVEFQVINSAQQPQSRTENFISGGPVRILMHIITSCLHDVRTPVESFQLVLDLLRFLTLREKSSLFIQQVRQVLGEEFDVNSVLVYNLFNRGSLAPDANKVQQAASDQKGSSMKFEETKSFGNQERQFFTRGQTLSGDQTQEIVEFQKHELGIYRLTIEGVFNTTQMHHMQEQLADKVKDQNKLPSFQDLQIAENCKNQLRKQKRWGFSVIDGFLFLQVIAESIQIIGRILQEESSTGESNDTAEFNVKYDSQRAFVDNSSDQVEVNSQMQEDDQMSYEQKPSPQQIKQKLASQTKLAKILPLCQFLYDCMKEQINGGVSNSNIDKLNTIQSHQYCNSVEEQLISRVTRFLDDTCFYPASEAQQHINLLSTFLENENNESALLIMDGHSESVNDSARMMSEQIDQSESESVKQNQQRAVVVLNTMGMVNENLLNRQLQSVRTQKKAPEIRVLAEEDFKTPQRTGEVNSQTDEETKLIEGGIRFSAIQAQYFGEDASALIKSQEQIKQPELSKIKSQQLAQSDKLMLNEQEFDLPVNINNTVNTMKESVNETQAEDDSRQSWVQTVKGDQEVVNMTRNISAQVSDSIQMLQNKKEEQSIKRNEYKQQVFEFLKKLFVALTQLNNEQNEASQLDLLEKIIYHTLFKEKQRKISISFGAATSHRFTAELIQVKNKAKEIFKNIQNEIVKILAEQKAELAEPEKRRNAKLLIGASVLQQNPMMQSQNFRAGSQFGDLSEMHSLTPQKKRENQFGVSTVAQSTGNFPAGQLASIASHKGVLHPLSTTVTMNVGAQLDISLDSPLDEKSTLDYIYTRNFFRKTIKRIQEDESSIWFDKVEEQLAEFKEIKEIYEQMQQKLEPHQLTANQIQVQKQNGVELKGKPSEMVKLFDQLLKNGENQIQNPSGRNYFVAQRRNIDSWGRMMLLKPNRKALEYQAWKFYDYFVHDFLNKAFAVSLLNDKDFADFIQPPHLYKQVQKSQSSQDVFQQAQKKKGRPNPQDESLQSVTDRADVRSDDSSFEGDQNSMDNSNENQDQQHDEHESQLQDQSDSVVSYSLELQRVRLDIMQRMERNKLLQRVLSEKQPLKRELVEDPLLVEKTSQKIERIVMNEEENVISSSLKHSFDAQNIKIKGNIWGKIIVTSKYFVFISYCRGIPDEQVKQLKYVDKRNNLLIKQEVILKWENIEEIMRRKVINVFQGIDLTTHDKKLYTFNLATLQNCDQFLKNVRELIRQRAKDGEELNLRLIEDPINHFKNVEQYQNEWKNGQRTNMEFLLLINKYSSRSFNDLSQYPIFPWVLNDYDSNVYEFDQLMKNEECFRDFTRHTGIMSQQKIEDIEEKFSEMEQVDKSGHKQGPEEFEKMTYGEDSFQMRMGFSTGMNTSHYLSRIEPFTTAVYFNQDQDRDKRIPISFQISWENTIKQNQSNNELIPEHFYYPEALVNLNYAHLGWQPDGSIDYQIDYMFIPQWAANHFDFIRIQRESLESRYVTENIGFWIDLVFGVNQKSVEKLNKFFCLAYEEWHQKPDNRAKTTVENMTSILDYYTVPSKLFDQTLISQQEIQQTAAAQSMQIDTTETKANFNPNFKLIKAFLEYKTNTQQKLIGNSRGLPPRQKLRLGQISVHNYLNQSTNIVHMLFNNEKKCLVFVRQEDPNDRNSEVGNLVVYVCPETLTKDGFKEKYFDLQMRYEWVAEELHNVFQVYFSQNSKNSSQQTMKLFACGYMDNSLRIFDLDGKAGPPKIIRDHNSRICCIKFSSDYKYLYSCDEDGVIIHYSRKKLNLKDQKETFPYSILYKLQDQMDEILAIDTNQTLDMYVTLSRDGTIAVRCQRTSKLWVHFKMFCKRQNTKKEEVIITGFNKAFRRIDAIRLSLHGYIVLVGSSVAPKSNQSKYLVYNLNGDTLLAQMEEKCTIKNVFLNSTEDLMVLAQNCSLSQDMSQQGNIRVLKLYGLEKIANLTKLCYEESLKEIRNTKASTREANTDSGALKASLKTPIIGAIALKKGEVSLNIFYIEPTKQTKEIICFESSKSTVWSQLEDMALAPKQRQDF